MTTVQIAVALVAAAGFIWALFASSKLRIRPWVLLAAGVCGVSLVALLKVFLYRTTSLQDMSLGLALICIAGPLLILVAYLLLKFMKKSPDQRNGRPARMVNTASLLKAGVAPKRSLINAQNTETLRLTLPIAHRSPGVAEAPLADGGEDLGEPAEPGEDGPAEEQNEEQAAPEAEAQNVEQAAPEAEAQSEEQAAPKAEEQNEEQAAPEAEEQNEEQAAPEAEEDLLASLEEGFRAEKERLEQEAEERRREQERLALERERRKQEERLALEEEVRRKEQERAEKEAEKRRRDQERRIRREEERRVKEEQQKSTSADTVNEAQRISQRIREERERVAMEERLRQEAAVSAPAGHAAEKPAVPEPAAEKAEEESWELEKARMARELEERRREQEKAAAEEKRWLEEMERKTREQEERRLEQEREEKEREQALREALEKRMEEAEAYLAQGRELLGGGSCMEAIAWLEKAARLDTTNKIKLDASIAIIEALAALGWKAEALKKMQAMKANLVIDPKSKKKLEEIVSKLIV